jgi:hypothetical protein
LRHGASLLLAYSIRKDMRQKEGEPSEPSFLRRAPRDGSEYCGAEEWSQDLAEGEPISDGGN